MEHQKEADSGLRRSRGRPRDWHDKTEQNTIKSLDRAMQVFEYLSQEQGKPLSLLAEETGQSPATLYRILVTLEGRGLVEFDAENQIWHIGSQAFVIGARFLRRTSLVERARPILRRLMEATGETANLGVEKGGMVLFLSQVETHENIRAFFPPGTLSPMHSSGIGKALLSQMSDDRFGQWLKDQQLEKFTDRTLANADNLRKDLKGIRQSGYSFDNEEKNVGMQCIAAPVFDMNGEVVAGLSISGPTSRMAMREIDDLGQAVIRSANELSNAIGGQVR
ncbi:transcriptional regulator, IclR family [Cognatiyoonia sediminum]|uniref:Transcriptional regulator, IclR family n=1 Tax=Cognatiyoonia sediminum TaxID=1508389 RepID=A0A1M5M561_9RHOB|nr:HTH-type transcriptional regulator BhcR [Cognatiyoonia sediminum]SHG72454.1 transcriptional regulator, IclR family [Cognatiyoonia sediminum]